MKGIVASNPLPIEVSRLKFVYQFEPPLSKVHLQMENGGNIYNINNNPFRNANTSHASSYHFFKHPAATIQGCGNTTTTTAAAITISTRFSETQHVDGGGCESLERVNGRCLTKKRRVCSGGGEGGRGTVVVVGQSASSAAAAPAELRCQVDGCHVELRRAKVYHKKHKVCEVHSKAQSVVMFGIDQRFCQQCSRFHAVSEFDESKRSCRRRLACHNQRRRKSSKDLHGNTKMQLPPNVCAHSLLSSNTTFWNSETADLSTQCSAALRELIAENRATVLAHQQHMLEKVIFSIHQREG